MIQTFDIYIKACNNHDIPKILGLFTDDFQLHFTEYDMKLGRDEMKDVLGWDKGVNGRISYHNLTVRGDTVSGVFTERNDFLELLGIEKLQAKKTFTFDKNGLIVEQVYTPLPDQPSFTEKLTAVVEWAEKHRPDELNEIYPDRQILFNQEMGRRWVTLLKEWKKS